LRQHCAQQSLGRIAGTPTFDLSSVHPRQQRLNMIKKRQMNSPGGQTMSAANQFYSLAA